MRVACLRAEDSTLGCCFICKKLAILYGLVCVLNLIGCNSSTSNLPPDIQLTSRLQALQATLVVLTARVSDRDGSIRSIRWQQVGGPAVELTNADMPEASFQAPNVSLDETLTFMLTATDDQDATVTRSVTVTVLAQSPHSVELTVPIGDGVISPYKLVARPGHPHQAFLITGQGESFGVSHLYEIDTSTFAILQQPLAIGRNGSDLLSLDNRLVVAARSSNELYLVDTDNWSILDRLALDFPPISLTQMHDQTFAVGGASAAGDVAIVSFEGDSLRIVNRVQLGSQTRVVVASLDRNQIFVSVPTVGVVLLDGAQLSVQHVIPIDGTPSFSIIQLDERHVVLADRDGYVRLIDLANLQVFSTDLAVVLGLDREVLPQRGIDSISLVAIDATHFAVLNDRKPSIVFNYEDSNVPLLTPVLSLPSASYAMFEASERELLAPAPGSNSISQIRLPSSFGGTAHVTRHVIGHSIVNADVSCVDSELAIMDSAGRVHFTNGFDTVSIKASQGSWHSPIAFHRDGTLFLIGRQGSANFLVRIDRDGSILSQTPVGLENVFSIKPDDAVVVLTDRIAARVEQVDLLDGASLIAELSHSRPRHTVHMGNGRLLAVHDTQPDIGITVVDGQLEISYTALELDRWWSNLVAWRRDGFAVASTFAGSIALVDGNGDLIKMAPFELNGVKELAPASSNSIWMTSEDLATSLEIAVPELILQKRIEGPGLLATFSCQGSNRAWMVTNMNAMRVQF